MIEDGFTEPNAGALAALTGAQRQLLEEKRQKDHKVRHYLFRAIDRVVFEQILDRRNSKIVWESLKAKFGVNERVKRSMLNALRRDFELLQMKEGESISDYFARVMGVANKMRSNGEHMRDYKIVQKILRTLTDKFTYVVVSIEESRDTTTMSVDDLPSSLLVHKQKFKRLGLEEEGQVLKAENSRSKGRGESKRVITDEDGQAAFRMESSRGRGRGPFRGGRGRGRGKQQSFSRAAVESYRCHNRGHFQYECPTWENEANYAGVNEDDELLLMAQIEEEEQNRRDVKYLANESKHSNMWFLDSGCSNHMCGNKDMFLEVVHCSKGFVKCGNNYKMEVAGKGSIKLTFNGTIFHIQDVYYVPELRHNLLSVGQIQEKGAYLLICDNVCSIYHPKRGLIARSRMNEITCSFC